MTIWNNIHTRRQQVLQGFGEGLNTFNDKLYIKDNEMVDCYNLIGDQYPSIRTRADRILQSLPASTEAAGVYNSIGVRTTTNAGTQIHKAFGNTWSYGLRGAVAWTNVSTTINPSTVFGKFVEFNTMLAKYTVLANSDGTFYNSYWDGATWSTFASTASPRSNLYTAHKYRLYGVDVGGRLLRYSAQGDITDWTTVEDAGWIDLTDQVGKANAITTFSDHVIVWSDKTMYELYGSNWDNYQLVNVSNKLGCVASRAYAECNGKLYWLDYSGVYVYTGGQPRQVAFQAKKYIEGINWDYKHLISAGAIDGKVLFSIPYQSTACNVIIDIDVREIDIGKVRVFTELGNFSGVINVDSYLIAMGTSSILPFMLHSTRFTGMDDSVSGGVSTTPIPWMIETKILSDIGFNVHTGISDIWIQHEGSSKATMSVGYWENKTINSTTYTSIGASSDFVNDPDTIRRTKLLLNYNQLQDINLYKLKVSGEGYKKLHGLQLNMYSYGGG
jgi:hypothetical protein